MVKKSVVTAVIAVALVTISASSAEAFFGWRHGCGGSWGGCRGSWGCRGGWGCSGCWGCRGCRGGWGCRGCNGCWGGCNGCWSGCQGCNGCYGSWGCQGCFGGYAISDAPRVYHAQSNVVREQVIASRPAVTTSLTLHVPPDAKVTLAGAATSQTGETRRYATSKLRAGQLWADYKVVVELPRGDQTLRQERTIKLTGGKSQELSINFDNTQVAQR